VTQGQQNHQWVKPHADNDVIALNFNQTFNMVNNLPQDRLLPSLRICRQTELDAQLGTLFQVARLSPDVKLRRVMQELSNLRVVRNVACSSKNNFILSNFTLLLSYVDAVIPVMACG